MTGPKPDLPSLPPHLVEAKTAKDYAHLPRDLVQAAETLAGPRPVPFTPGWIDKASIWRQKVNQLIEAIATTRARDSLPGYTSSPFMDSLQTVMGGEPSKGYNTRARGNTLGLFHPWKGIDFHPRLFSEDTLPSKDRANLHVPSQSRKEALDFVAAHEHGHQLDAGLIASWTIGDEFRNTFYPEGAVGRKPKYRVKYQLPVDDYSKRGGEPEHFAQAAANAFDFLRVTKDLNFGNDTKARDIVRTVIDARERDIPGTLMLLDYFLKNDLYEKHPLRKHLQELREEFYQPIKKKRK